ncbi:WXG100-like domain-containing protein, partial [Actinokineospora sp.]|uniref:WXG100-like domain-containing protein n=1 Tax=Actinokineospora sp. TaxID=1872133 RepID=UPI004037C84B
MAIPEPPDDHGFWSAVKAASIDQLWPPDNEDVAFALYESWKAAADAVDAMNNRAMGAGDLAHDAWPDQAGYGFYAHVQHLTTGSITTADAAGSYRQLAIDMRALGEFARQYAEDVQHAKNAIRVEIAITVGLFALALAFPGIGAAIAARIVSTVASRLSGFIAGMAGRVAASGLNRFATLATRAGGEVAQEAFEETFIEGVAQYLGKEFGYRQNYNLRDVGIAAGAGGLGGALAPGVRGALRPATGALESGLRRTGLPDPVLRQTTRAVDSFTTNGITSPIAGYAAHNIADGNYSALTNVGGYVDAVREGGVASGLAGSARANTVLLGEQLGTAIRGGPPPPPVSLVPADPSAGQVPVSPGGGDLAGSPTTAPPSGTTAPPGPGSTAGPDAGPVAGAGGGPGAGSGTGGSPTAGDPGSGDPTRPGAGSETAPPAQTSTDPTTTSPTPGVSPPSDAPAGQTAPGASPADTPGSQTTPGASAQSDAPAGQTAPTEVGSGTTDSATQPGANQTTGSGAGVSGVPPVAAAPITAAPAAAPISAAPTAGAPGASAAGAPTTAPPPAHTTTATQPTHPTTSTASTGTASTGATGSAGATGSTASTSATPGSSSSSGSTGPVKPSITAPGSGPGPGGAPPHGPAAHAPPTTTPPRPPPP